MEGKRLVILGAGESGIGSALLAKAKGFVPFVSDGGTIKPEYRKELQRNYISFEEGKHNIDLILSADTIIKSPGIPGTIKVLQQAREKGIEIISEIEFASRFTQAKIIAITGTNGKTTTALLTYYLLKEGGANVCIAGNIGNSFAKEVINDHYDYYILEISSFQLEDIQTFRPDIAILLNITSDHLDRYNGNFQDYVETKFRIIRNMRKSDAFIYNSDDSEILEYISSHKVIPDKYEVSLTHKVNTGGYLHDTILYFPIKNSKAEFSVPVSAISLKGSHNLINASSSTIASLLINLQFKAIRNGLETFENIPHRMEKVAEIDEVEFINDSKATNIDSVKYALQSFDKSIIWIAGGVDKGNDYSKLYEIVPNRVKALICLGKDNMKLKELFHKKIDVIDEFDDMDNAVNRAFSLAQPGDLVLLSPACASFDLFDNYRDRGNKFKAAVKKLKNQTPE